MEPDYRPVLYEGERSLESQSDGPVARTALTTAIHIIPGEVKSEALMRKFAEDEIRWLDFPYIDITQVKKRLNEAFGVGGWTFVQTGRTRIPVERKDAKPGEEEIMVEGVIIAPGLISTGIWGVGSGTWRPQNARATYANALATAESEAIKNAAKKLGLGLDLLDEEGTRTEKLMTTVNELANILSEDGKKAQLLTVVSNLAPEAILENEIHAARIPVDKLDRLQKELVKLMGAA